MSERKQELIARWKSEHDFLSVTEMAELINLLLAYDAGKAAREATEFVAFHTMTSTPLEDWQPTATPGHRPTPTNETEAALQHVNWLINDGFHQMFMAVVHLRDVAEEALAATKEPKV